MSDEFTVPPVPLMTAEKARDIGRGYKAWANQLCSIEIKENAAVQRSPSSGASRLVNTKWWPPRQQAAVSAVACTPQECRARVALGWSEPTGVDNVDNVGCAVRTSRDSRHQFPGPHCARTPERNRPGRHSVQDPLHTEHHWSVAPAAVPLSFTCNPRRTPPCLYEVNN